MNYEHNATHYIAGLILAGRWDRIRLAAVGFTTFPVEYVRAADAAMRMYYVHLGYNLEDVLL